MNATVSVFLAAVPKSRPLEGNNAKVALDSLHNAMLPHKARPKHEVHSPVPKALSLTNATEWGTLYRVSEVAELAAVAHGYNLPVHVDGARFANGVAAAGCSPADLTWKAGVDVLSFGGSKNGLLFGEAVVFFRQDLANEFEFRLKQSGQLTSKMRFIAAQWLGLLSNELWLDRAAHANAMAARLSRQLQKIPGVEIVVPVEANAVFAKIPAPVVGELKRLGHSFYDGARSRFMCSWDNTAADVDELVKDVRRALKLNPLDTTMESRILGVSSTLPAKSDRTPIQAGDGHQGPIRHKRLQSFLDAATSAMRRKRGP
jgi:threonine aldolase